MLRCFGSVSDDNPEFAWLFLEDGGDSHCSLAEHGQLAARWLGTLHGAAGALEVVPSLPARGPGHFLGHLRGGRSTMVDCLDNEALGAGDQDMLAGLIATCDCIESQWAGVEAACRGLPQTLLHGDVDPRNLRVRHDETGPAVVAFDWEWSGFGVPAVDVYQLALHATRRDLSAYRATISSFGDGLDEDALRALVSVGMGFRLLASVDWVVPHLRFARPQRATATLRIYDQPLREWADRLAMLT
jgi:aminoglycoside phosphotransferase (APT) family kinase protein